MSAVDSMAWPLGAFALDGTTRLLSLAPLLASWLSAISTFSALVWLSWRAWLVLAKPVEELTSLLGIELPVAPDVVLAGIKADGVILHWKPPEHKGVVVKYHIVVNGITVGEVPPQDTTITIQCLLPSHNYIVRVIALNSISFQAASAPIRLRTRAVSSDDVFDSAFLSKVQDYGDEEGYHPTPIVKQYKPLLEVDSPLPTPPLMAREHSNSLGSKSTATAQAKRLPRRNSPASLTPDYPAIGGDITSEPAGSYQQLSEKVEFLRRETDETESQIRDESADYDKQITDLQNQRDLLKQSLKEREDASKELKRQVASLERANTSAQAKRAAQEKSLHQKENERRKMKEDVERWEIEVENAHHDLVRVEQEKGIHKQMIQQNIAELKAKLDDELNTNRSLEENIRERGIQLQELERVKRKANGHAEGSPDRADAQLYDVEEDRVWEMRVHQMQQEYAAAFNQMAEAQRMNGMLQSQLEELQRRRLSQPQMYANPPVLEGVPMRMNSQRRRRAGSSRNETTPAANVIYNMASNSSFNNSSISSISPIYSPYIDMRNGMALQPLEQRNGLSPADLDRLTAGAPMSPTAGALLPSDLFANDIDPPDMPKSMDATVRALPGTREEERTFRSPSPPPPLQTHASGSYQQESPSQRPFAPILPGLGPVSSVDIRNGAEQTPGSPSSVQSRPPSLWASPQHSTTNLPFYTHPEAADSDRRSIRSTSSSLRQISGNHSSRFAGIFPARLRGKTTSDQGTPLGALKAVQSRSMPRNDLDDLDPPNHQRRRGSHSGAGTWMNTMSNAFTRSNTVPQSRPDISAPISATPLGFPSSQSLNSTLGTRKRPFTMFSVSPWSSNIRPESPATTSVSEAHGASLPPPTTDGQQRFGWPINQPLGVGTDWGMTASNSWSRHPSRRPSVNSTLMPLGHDPVMEADGQEYETVRPPTQAPIGTDRPHSSAGASIEKPGSPPRLNPAAQDFTSMFTTLRSGSSEEKAAARAKAGEEKAAAKAKAEEQREQKKAEAKERRERKKAEKAEKSAEKAAARAKGKEKSKDDKEREISDKLSVETPHMENREFYPFSSFGTSPATSRKSRDTPSITATDPSFRESRDSLEHAISRTPSEGVNLAPLSAVRTKESDSKETFMQKLQRKSSTTMFNLSTFGNKPSSLFSSRNNTPKLSAGEFTDEADEDSGIGSSVGDMSEVRRDKEKEKMTKSGGLMWGGLGLRKMSKKEKASMETDSVSGDEVGLGMHS